MLIQPASKEELLKWTINDRLSHQNLKGFKAVDRMTSDILGFVLFSDQQIVSLKTQEVSLLLSTGKQLIQVAINQMDRNLPIMVKLVASDFSSRADTITLLESMGFVRENNEDGIEQLKRGATGEKRKGSFHHNFERYSSWTDEKNCPVCNNDEGPSDIVTIKELEYSWVEASIHAQGCLWGKCHVLSKKHFVELHDIPEQDMLNFMRDIQKVGKALKEVSKAIKINYELHGNSMPHLHMHLFPRYIDDAFPSGGINVNKITPNPYKNEEEFICFVESMRDELSSE